MAEDLQDQVMNPLVDPLGECTLPLLSLVVTGKATPYFHNGIITAAQDPDDTTVWTKSCLFATYFYLSQLPTHLLLLSIGLLWMNSKWAASSNRPQKSNKWAGSQTMSKNYSYCSTPKHTPKHKLEKWFIISSDGVRPSVHMSVRTKQNKPIKNHFSG